MPTPSLRRLLLAGGVILACSAGPALAQNDPAQIVATVDGEPVTMGDVARAASRLPAEARQAPLHMLVDPVVRLIAVNRILSARAEAENLADDPEVAGTLANIRVEVLASVYLQRTVDAAVTEQRLQEAYAGFVEAQAGAEEVRARHILVETEEEARAVIDLLIDGGDFATLAEEHSTGPSGPNGGDLGYFQTGQMVEPFGEVAFGLDPGAFTADPVQTQFGWHVIFSEDKRAAVPPELDEVRAELTAELASVVQLEIVEAVEAAAEIILLDADGNPVATQASE